MSSVPDPRPLARPLRFRLCALASALAEVGAIGVFLAGLAAVALAAGA